MSGRRALFGAAATLALGSSVLADRGRTKDRLATIEDLAVLEFEGIPGLSDDLGDRAHWMAGAAEWWATMRLSVAVLERSHIQLASGITEELEEAHLQLAQSAGATADYLAGCVEALRATEVRIMAAAARRLAAL